MHFCRCFCTSKSIWEPSRPSGLLHSQSQGRKFCPLIHIRATKGASPKGHAKVMKNMKSGGVLTECRKSSLAPYMYWGACHGDTQSAIRKGTTSSPMPLEPSAAYTSTRARASKLACDIIPVPVPTDPLARNSHINRYNYPPKLASSVVSLPFLVIGTPVLELSSLLSP